MATTIPDFEICVMSTSSGELDTPAGCCEVSDIDQLLHLGQNSGYFEIYKLSFKAGVI